MWSMTSAPAIVSRSSLLFSTMKMKGFRRPEYIDIKINSYKNKNCQMLGESSHPKKEEPPK
jgi:hypothetical protein